MLTRKAYYVKPGNFKNLKSITEDLRDPENSEVLVEIKAIGLNFADVFCLLGLYEAAPKESFTPGLEYCGKVIAIGSNVVNYKVGDKVMGLTRFGAYCSHLNINQKYVTPLPEGWSYEEGSGYLVQALTAYYGLVELGNLSPGQTVLIHSAAGGVGIWANRICKRTGCHTIGTVGGSSKLELLKSEGYDQFIVRDIKSFKKQLSLALDSRSLDLIMDSIGGSVLQDGYDLLAPMGRVISFGSAHYGNRRDSPNYLRLLWKYLRRPKIDPQTMIGENKSVMGFNLIYLFNHADLMHEILDKVKQLDLGKPIIGNTYSYTDLPDALREFQGGNTTGKLVVKV